MPIATEVAKVEGWRIRVLGRGRKIHDVLTQPPGARCKPAEFTGPTLRETQEIKANYGSGRIPTIRPFLFL